MLNSWKIHHGHSLISDANSTLMISGACVVACKLKELRTKADLVCMVTPDVSTEARECLSQVFDVMYDVPYMKYKCEEETLKPYTLQASQLALSESWKECLFTKWNALGLTPYDKVSEEMSLKGGVWIWG